MEPIHMASILNDQQLEDEDCEGHLIQPLMPFEYEISFYFIGKQFYYSLYAPDPEKRWELKLFKPLKEEVDFALKFIHWNTCKMGIQRVDACRLKSGELLLAKGL